MVDRFYGYQYDTSPRKLSQEQIPYRNRYSQKKADIASNYNEKDDSIKLKKSEAESLNIKKSSYDKKKETIARNNYNANYKTQPKTQNSIQKEDKNNRAKNSLKNTTYNIKVKLKMVMFLITGFSILFAISYQNSLISESFNRKEQYKKKMEALSKTNQQIEVGIENSLNLNNIEQAAKDKLGMKKLDNNQKIYVSLPKQDYVAPAAEQIIMEEEMGFFEKLVKGFTKSVR